jgi:oligopeptide/dipeptide ABC transporter ATP-binding protein
MPNLLTINNLTKKFPIKSGFLGKTTNYVHAVNDVSLNVKQGEILGLVGESGCGKSTLGRTILKLHEPNSGQIIFDGKDITNYSSKEMLSIRRDMQIIFQDPYGSLNPRMTVGKTIMEPLTIHGVGKKNERKDKVIELLEIVGLKADHFDRYPHQFSGGQRQRIGIARALALNPKLIIADEPVSALDVSIQAQIINLLADLQKKFNLTMIFISHDIRVVEHLCDQVMVMYLGKVMETLPASQLHQAKHPYTKSLISSVPIANPHQKVDREILSGDIPSPINLPSGCVFHTRCPIKEDQCERKIPQLKELSENQKAACLLV